MTLFHPAWYTGLRGITTHLEDRIGPPAVSCHNHTGVIANGIYLLLYRPHVANLRVCVNLIHSESSEAGCERKRVGCRGQLSQALRRSHHHMGGKQPAIVLRSKYFLLVQYALHLQNPKMN